MLVIVAFVPVIVPAERKKAMLASGNLIDVLKP
jgi:hypothetical protein